MTRKPNPQLWRLKGNDFMMARRKLKMRGCLLVVITPVPRNRSKMPRAAKSKTRQPFGSKGVFSMVFRTAITKYLKPSGVQWIVIFVTWIPSMDVHLATGLVMAIVRILCVSTGRAHIVLVWAPLFLQHPPFALKSRRMAVATAVDNSIATLRVWIVLVTHTTSMQSRELSITLVVRVGLMRGSRHCSAPAHSKES